MSTIKCSLLVATLELAVGLTESSSCRISLTNKIFGGQWLVALQAEIGQNAQKLTWTFCNLNQKNTISTCAIR